MPLLTVEQLGFDHNTIGGFGPTHDFQNFYEKIIDECPPNSTIVEVGCFRGRSLVHLGCAARHANKGLKIIGVDHSKGQSCDLAKEVVANLKLAGLLQPEDELQPRLHDLILGSVSYRTTPLNKPVVFIEADSVGAASSFQENSVWCVFLDDGHLHEEVAAGIDAWMPKVQPGGVLAGHDAKWNSVWEVCVAKLKGVIHDPMYSDCWFCEKETPLTDVDIKMPVRIAFAEGDAHYGYGVGDKRSDGLLSGSPLVFPKLPYGDENVLS